MWARLRSLLGFRPPQTQTPPPPLEQPRARTRPTPPLPAAALAPTIFGFDSTASEDFVSEARSRFENETITFDQIAAKAVGPKGINLSRLIEAEADAIMAYLDKHWDIEVAVSDAPEDTRDGYVLEQHGNTSEGESLAAQSDRARQGKDALRAMIEGILGEGLNVGHHDVDKHVEDWAGFFNSARERALGFLEGQDVPRAIEYRKKPKRPDYDFLMSGLKSSLSKNFEWSAKPKGYDEVKKNGNSADSFENGGDDWEFEGTKLHFHLGAGCLDFGTGMNISHIFYSDSDQSRNPHEELIGYVLRQGINIALTSTYQAYESGLSQHTLKLNRLLKGRHVTSDRPHDAISAVSEAVFRKMRSRRTGLADNGAARRSMARMLADLGFGGRDDDEPAEKLAGVHFPSVPLPESLPYNKTDNELLRNAFNMDADAGMPGAAIEVYRTILERKDRPNSPDNPHALNGIAVAITHQAKRLIDPEGKRWPAPKDLRAAKKLLTEAIDALDAVIAQATDAGIYDPAKNELNITDLAKFLGNPQHRGLFDALPQVLYNRTIAAQQLAAANGDRHWRRLDTRTTPVATLKSGLDQETRQALLAGVPWISTQKSVEIEGQSWPHRISPYPQIRQTLAELNTNAREAGEHLRTCFRDDQRI